MIPLLITIAISVQLCKLHSKKALSMQITEFTMNNYIASYIVIFRSYLCQYQSSFSCICICVYICVCIQPIICILMVKYLCQLCTTLKVEGTRNIITKFNPLKTLLKVLYTNTIIIDSSNHLLYYSCLTETTPFNQLQ